MLHMSKQHYYMWWSRQWVWCWVLAMGVMLGVCAGNVKCGSSIYRCTLDIKNRTGLSHYAWNLLHVCKYDTNICCNILCLDSQLDCCTMTRVVWMPFALPQLRPEEKCPDTASSGRKMPCHGVYRRKMPCHAQSGKQMPWRAVFRCTVPWWSASELSRLHLKRPEYLVRQDANDSIFFFPLAMTTVKEKEC